MDDLFARYENKANELKKQKKFEESLINLDKAKQIVDDEKCADYWYKKGNQFFEVGEFEKALDCFDNEINKHNKSYEVFFAKGKTLFGLHEYAQAHECFNKAAELRNQNYLQKSKTAKQLKKAKKFEKALIYDDNASQESLIDAQYWYYKGITLLKLKKYDSAHFSLITASDLDPSEPKITYELAKCELFCGNEQKCIEILQRCLDKNPTFKEKLRDDGDFSILLKNNQFRSMIRL